MQLEEYFELDNPNGIRVRGTRVNIEVVIRETLDGSTPEQIVQDYPALSAEQVHAALTYYYHNRQAIDEYIVRQEKAYVEAKRKNEEGERPEVVKRLLQEKAEHKGRVSP